MPKVTIIVPMYNVEDYVQKCMDSLINQTLKEIEIIIVNDGSTDNSKEKIQKYLKDNRVKYFEKENGGLSDARNYGIPYAKGEYIGFVDSDDYVELDMYEKMYNKAFEENSDIVECDFIWEYPKKNKIDVGKIYDNKKRAIVDARVVAWNKIYKKELLDKTQIKFPKGLRYEDVEFFYKLVPYVKKFSFIKEPFVHYMQRDSSIINTQNERTAEIFEVLENVINYYKENNFYYEYKNELEYVYARFLLCSSLKRMAHIQDVNTRKKLLNETYKKLNKNFPEWKKNKILKEEKTLKNFYMRSVNSFTFKIYSKII